MTPLAVTAGIAIVLVFVLDIGLTVLHPTIQGPLSHRLTRLVWLLIRAVARYSRCARLLVFAGPMATVALLFAWLAGLWIGFALIYLPFVHHFFSSVHFGHKGIFAALYTSATMLTTLGLGDVLPTQDGMRIAVVCEAAAGVATVSAAISYILSVYPLATQTRAHALYLSDLQLTSPTAASEYLSAKGNSGLEEIHQRLIDGHQSLRRFPVLYYFHPSHERESVKRLLESATVLCALARWAPPRQFSTYERRLAAALQSTLARIGEDYRAKYIGGHPGQARTDRLPTHDPAAALRSLRTKTGNAEHADENGRLGLEEFSAFITEMDELLAGLARSHLYSHKPLSERFAGQADDA